MGEDREKYLEGRVQTLMAQVAGLQEALTANEYLMAAMVKCAGGDIVVGQDDIKAATEKGIKVLYHYDVETRLFVMKTTDETAE